MIGWSFGIGSGVEFFLYSLSIFVYADIKIILIKFQATFTVTNQEHEINHKLASYRGEVEIRPCIL